LVVSEVDKFSSSLDHIVHFWGVLEDKDIAVGFFVHRVAILILFLSSEGQPLLGLQLVLWHHLMEVWFLGLLRHHGRDPSEALVHHDLLARVDHWGHPHPGVHRHVLVVRHHVVHVIAHLGGRRRVHWGVPWHRHGHQVWRSKFFITMGEGTLLAVWTGLPILEKFAFDCFEVAGRRVGEHRRLIGVILLLL